MIPKTTDPLTKFIRTGEGVLVFAFNIALVLVPIVSNSLTAAQSAKWATIIDGIAVISRTGLKMVASAQAKPAMTVAAAPGDAIAAYAVAAAAPAPAPVAPDALTPPTGQFSPSVIPQAAAAVAPDIAAAGQLVADAEEFADPPTVADSELMPPPNGASPAGNGQPQNALAGSNSLPAAPFMARLGG